MFCLVLKSVHLRRPNCTHSTSLLLVSNMVELFKTSKTAVVDASAFNC